jgi:hypothetical protein
MRRLTGIDPRRFRGGIGARCAFALTCVCAARGQTPLPGTQPLTEHGDFGARMVDNINAFLEQQTAHSAAGRPSYWRRDYASRADYEQSISENRKRLRKIIGAVDPRVHFADLELVGTMSSPALIASRDGY